MKIFEKVDSIILKTPDPNFFYFTKLEGTWEASFAIVFPDGVEVVAPPLERGEAKFYKGREEMERILKDAVTGDKIGFNGSSLPHATYRYLRKLLGGKWIDVRKELAEMRLVKNREEIMLIKKACRETARIITALSMENKRETEVAAEIEYEMRRRGMKPAFDTIAAFGKNAASPHHIPGRKRYVTPAIIDAGARYRNYCSDLTFTAINRRGRRLYEMVEEALYMAVDEMGEGAKASDVAKMVEDFFRKHGYEMRHALGHSIGIEVHDGFSLSARSNFVLRENMVFAVEPAIYTRNMGVRIERDVVVGRKGAEIIR